MGCRRTSEAERDRARTIGPTEEAARAVGGAVGREGGILRAHDGRQVHVDHSGSDPRRDSSRGAVAAGDGGGDGVERREDRDAGDTEAVDEDIPEEAAAAGDCCDGCGDVGAGEPNRESPLRSSCGRGIVDRKTVCAGLRKTCPFHFRSSSVVFGYTLGRYRDPETRAR